MKFKDKICKDKTFKLIMWLLLAIVIIVGLYASQKVIYSVTADEKEPFVIYLDVQNAKEFAENGVGIYAYNSASEKDSSVPAEMKPSEMGKGIYEYTLDRKWKYVAFTGGFGSWNYELATLPVNIEWEHNTPCFVLAKPDGTNTRGVWRNLSSTLYFDASLIKNKKVFVENGVYVCAYEEIENSDGLVVVQKPVRMQQSEKGEDIYEYTFDRPYSIVRFMLGDTTDAEPASDLVNIDWSGYASPCYRMTLPDSYEDVEPEETSTEESSVEESETEESESEESSVEESDSEESSAEESSVEESESEESSAEESETEKSSVEESSNEESSVEGSTVEESSEQESSIEESAAQESSVEESSAQESTTETSETKTSSAVESTTVEEISSAEAESSAVEQTAIEHPETAEGAMSEEYSEEMQSAKSINKWVKIALAGQEARTVFRVTDNRTPAEETLANISENESSSAPESSSPKESERAIENESQKESERAIENESQDESERTSEHSSEKETESTSEASSESEQEGTSEASSESEPESASEDGSESEQESSSSGEGEGEEPDGELYDIDADTLMYAEVADVPMLLADATTVRTIYFDSEGNSSFGWDTDADIWAFLFNGSDKSIAGVFRKMEVTYRPRINPDNPGKLWKYTLSDAERAKYDSVIFVLDSDWNGGNTRQTTNTTLSGSYPCYYIFAIWNSGTDDQKRMAKIMGDLGPETMKDQKMYFYDVAGKLGANVSDVYAVFSISGAPDTIPKVTVQINDKGEYVIPEDYKDVNNNAFPYDTVQFRKDAVDIGEAWNFIDYTGTATNGFLFEEGEKDTYYYAATEKKDGTIISGWGKSPSTANDSLANKTLYFDKLHFPTKRGTTTKTGKLQIGDDSDLITLGNPKDSDDNVTDRSTFCYKFPADTTATQQTVLTFIDEEGTEFHFRWTDFGADVDHPINMVTLDNSIANVSKTYSKAVTVYFDATYSKLEYSDASSDRSMPKADGKLYYYAIGSGNPDLSDEMKLVDSYVDDDHIWSDVYKADLPEGYTNIIFSNYKISITNNPTPGSYGTCTLKLDIPTDIANPCFYADTGDMSVYENIQRGGYWDEVYTIRDVENKKPADAGQTKRDIVDINSADFTRNPSVLYVNTTFYDYYTDYELNGNNRDSYDRANGGSQRNWVTFRQFDQALSEYYRQNSVDIPIYTGHFQPADWTNPFNAIAPTLDLYGHSNTNAFYSTNNSSYTIKGGPAADNDPIYFSAAQGLVDSELKNQALMMKAGSKKVSEPHFDEDFLTGNNSKNAVLGEVYHDVAFPFQLKPVAEKDDENNDVTVKYWCFDSADTTLAMQRDNGTYYLQDVGTSVNREWSRNVDSKSVSTGKYGFFPFNATSQNTHANTYNYGFGAKLEFKFRLTEDGTVTGVKADNTTSQVPITFEFSGDDDVWVFIDGNLILDVGGAHGVSTGRINFKDKSSSELGYQITATVDRVKASAGYGADGTAGYLGAVTKNFTLKGTSATEHTLTMFYMERGMWESNMKISFNFPDENKLEVEKQVDKAGVNPIFQDLFDNKSLFTFHIETQATHYAPCAVQSSGTTVSPITFNDTMLDGTLSKAAEDNTFKWVNEKGDHTNVALWNAKLEDKTGAYRDLRYGTIGSASGAVVNIEGMRYLEFKFFYDYPDTPSLTNMYLQIVDANGCVWGNRKDSKGNYTDYLAGKTYGMPSMAGGKWITVKIDLELLDKDSLFDSKQVKEIKFGYNYPRDIYLDDFIFKSAATSTGLTGFVVKQNEIPDYGSAKTGTMVIPKDAVYSSTTGTNGIIEDDGTFVLQNGEVITFTNQFRRGSYIYLEEDTNPLFETTYTMKENGQPVSSFGTGSGNMVTNGTIDSLINIPVPKTEPGTDTKIYSVDDDRTEQVITTEDSNGINPITNNGYTVANQPDKETFVYRSYANPDEEISTTKLRIVFTNTVKTGSLKVRKATRYPDDETLTGTYTFRVTFSNIGGIALENSPIIMEFSLKAGEEKLIEGIPIGTFYTVEELTPTDGSYLDEVTITNAHYSPDLDPNHMKIHTDTGTIEADITQYSTPDIVTFKNTMEPKIAVTVEKNWEEEVADLDLEGSKPTAIYVQLQRKQKDTEDAFTVVTGYEKIELQETYEQVAEGTIQKVWKYTITGLDEVVGYPNPAYDDISKYPKWIYRFVEVDESGNEIENSSVITLTKTSEGKDNDFAVTYEPPKPDSDTRNYTITNTLLGPVNLQIKKKSMQDDSAIMAVDFKLYKLIDGTKNMDLSTMKDATTDVNGIATFTGLEKGTYKLTEMKTASDYSLLKESIIIIIDRKTGTYKYCMESEYDPDTTNVEDLESLTFDSNTRTITFNIKNAHNIVLPATGWNGLWKGIAIISAMAMMFAIMLIREERKRRRRRLRQRRRREGRPPKT